MKKTIILFLTLMCVSIGASAMSLKDAFKALSNIQNVEMRTPDYNLPVESSKVGNAQIAAAYNLNSEQIKTTATEAYTILNQVPMAQMINGGSNLEVAAFVYAVPTGENSNELLVVAMSGYKGSAVFIDLEGVTNEECQAIQNGSFKIEGNFLSLESVLPDGDTFNITMSKAR